MNIKRKSIEIMIIIIILFLLFSMLITKENKIANADGSSIFYIDTFDVKDKSKNYFSSEDGCTYIIHFFEDKDVSFDRVLYSAIKISMNEEIVLDNEGNFINPDYVINENDEEINRLEIDSEDFQYGQYNSQDLREITFEVVANEWCAFQFYVQWTNDDEMQEMASDILYCTKIDSAPPYITLETNPIYQDGGYLFNYIVRANEINSYATANSGFSKVRTYRIADGEEETIEEITNFDSPLYFRNEIKVKEKGEYFIEAFDGVGNRSYGRVAKIDYDIDESILIASVENILENRNDYEENLIELLEEKYNYYSIIKLDEDSTEQEKEAARLEVLVAQSAVKEALMEFEIKIINEDFVGNLEIEDFGDSNFSDIIKKGEKVVLQVAIASYDLYEIKKADLLEYASLPNADKVLSFDIASISNTRGIINVELSSPMKFIIPFDEKYKEIKAVLKLENNGEIRYEDLRIDEGENWIAIYVPYSEAEINLIIDYYEKNNLKYLYFLFLLIPLGAGIFFLIKYRDRIFKNK